MTMFDSTPVPCDLDRFSRPAVLREREEIHRAVRLALVQFGFATLANPAAQLDRLARDFVRDLSAAGLELRRRVVR
jgi:hypothetical protein